MTQTSVKRDKKGKPLYRTDTLDAHAKACADYDTAFHAWCVTRLQDRWMCSGCPDLTLYLKVNLPYLLRDDEGHYRRMFEKETLRA